MTPDRHDETPDDAHEHGVLADVGTVDTAGIGILDGRTAQVSVILPAGSEDDDPDDDAVDEVVADEVPTGDIILEDAPGAIPAVDAYPADEPVDAYPAVDPVDEVAEAEIDDEHDGAQAPSHEDGTAAGAGVADESDAAEPAPEPAAAAPRATPVGAPIPLTGAIPTTRREAHHAADEHHDRGERAHAVERVHPPQPEVSLVSKRLGEFDAQRETSDLLTPDRLLDRAQLGRAEPEGLWQQLVYSLSGHRINLGDSRKARARKELDKRIAAALPGGARFVPVLSRKGGVGKTTVTTLLGMALASARDDRVIAVDANPDRGTLADRLSRPSGRTVRDLARTRSEVSGFNDVSTIVARDDTRLDVLASDADPRVSEAFSDRDYHDVAALAAHYYSIVLTDTGTGIVHSVMGATLELADQLVVVAGLSVDEARLASETLTWLETNGYAEQVRAAVVVLNNARPGTPLVRESELEAHFRTRVRAVVRMPYDPLIGTGSAISFRDLQPATRQAARELAAAVVEGLRTLAPAA